MTDFMKKNQSFFIGISFDQKSNKRVGQPDKN
jgi:hypothetical protein